MKKKKNHILQFKITLTGSSPSIWRRFWIESNLKFYDLHLVIQVVMGWTNSHLYQFIYERHSFIGNPELLESDDAADDKETSLQAIFDSPGTTMVYEYDFGDGWKHDLELETIVEKKPSQQYPFCLEGELNCPPEDCGGIPGFYEMMKVLKNKRHPEHKETKEWLGDLYDPKSFDLKAVNENLKTYTDIDLGLD